MIFRFSFAAPNRRSKSPNGSISPKYATPRSDVEISLAPEHLGSTKAVFDRLAHKLTQQQRKEFISPQIQEAHGLGIHGINQSAPVNEVALSGHKGLIEIDKVFRSDADISVQNHQNVAGRLSEAQPDRIPFASAFLHQDLDVLIQRAGRYPTTLLKRVVFGVALDKDQLSVRAHRTVAGRRSVEYCLPHCGKDKSQKPTAWDESAGSRIGRATIQFVRAKLAHKRQRCEKTIDERSQKRDVFGQKDMLTSPQNLKVCEIEQDWRDLL